MKVHRRLDDPCDIADIRRDNGFDRSTVQAIFEVMFLEHERCRNHNCPQLCKGERRKPELVVTAQDYHDEIAAPDADIRQEVSGFIRPCFHVGKREYMFLAFRIAPNHRSPFWIVHRDIIDDIVCEVEVIGVMDRIGLKHTCFVVSFINVALVYVSHGVSLSVMKGV